MATKGSKAEAARAMREAKAEQTTKLPAEPGATAKAFLDKTLGERDRARESNVRQLAPTKKKGKLPDDVVRRSAEAAYRDHKKARPEGSEDEYVGAVWLRAEKAIGRLGEEAHADHYRDVFSQETRRLYRADRGLPKETGAEAQPDVEQTAPEASRPTARQLAHVLRQLSSARRVELYSELMGGRPPSPTATISLVCSVISECMQDKPLPDDVAALVAPRRKARGSGTPRGERGESGVLVVLRDALLKMRPGEQLDFDSFEKECAEHGIKLRERGPFLRRGEKGVVPALARILSRPKNAALASKLAGRIVVSAGCASVKPE